MNEQIIYASRLFIKNSYKEDLLRNSTFMVTKGDMITFSYSSHYALLLSHIFLNPLLNYEGTFLYHGKPVGRRNPIHSFLVSPNNLLVDDMSISENIMSLQADRHWYEFYNPRKAMKIMKLYEKQHPLPFELSLPVKALTNAQRYIVFLIKSMLTDSEIILLDELPDDCGTDELKWIEQFIQSGKQKGVTFLYFTRRDGSLAAMSDYIYFIHFHTITNMMFADEYNIADYRKALFDKHIQRVSDRTSCIDYTKKIAAVQFTSIFSKAYSLELFKGEVFGILDLYGSFAHQIYHYFEEDFQYSIDGKACTSYIDAVRKGLAMISFHNGNPLFETLSFRENLSLQILQSISNRLMVVNRRMEKYLTNLYAQKFSTCSRNENEYSFNLQMLMYRWLMTGPKLMVIDNPLLMDMEDNFYKDFQNTVSEVIQKGTAVLLVTNLPNTCLKICDRVLIIRKYGEYRLFDLAKDGEEAANTYIKCLD